MNFYIHIPFCKSKCKYCHFASFSGIENKLKNKYLEKLSQEIRDFLSKNQEEKIDTIYFGGGTPSILNIQELGEILKIFSQFKNFFQNTEITLEANPENITPEYLAGLKQLGINRISVGIQSLNDRTLVEIGRCNSDIITKSLFYFKQSGFENIGVDFILGLPYVEKYEIINDIEKILKIVDIKHISVYMLEEDNYPKNWKDLSIKEEDFQDEYCNIVNFLDSKGFLKYEISNFAKKGLECIHNKSYWNHSNYRGFGLSSASYIDGFRFANSNNFIDYFAGKLDYNEELNQENIILEKIMFDIRTSGVDFVLAKNEEKLKEFIVLKWLKKTKNKIILTDRGTLFVDYILKEVFL